MVLTGFRGQKNLNVGSLEVIPAEIWPVHGVGARFVSERAHLSKYSSTAATTARPKVLAEDSGYVSECLVATYIFLRIFKFFCGSVPQRQKPAILVSKGWRL